MEPLSDKAGAGEPAESGLLPAITRALTAGARSIVAKPSIRLFTPKRFQSLQLIKGRSGSPLGSHGPSLREVHRQEGLAGIMQRVALPLIANTASGMVLFHTYSATEALAARQLAGIGDSSGPPSRGAQGCPPDGSSQSSPSGSPADCSSSRDGTSADGAGGPSPIATSAESEERCPGAAAASSASADGPSTVATSPCTTFLFPPWRVITDKSEAVLILPSGHSLAATSAAALPASAWQADARPVSREEGLPEKGSAKVSIQLCSEEIGSIKKETNLTVEARESGHEDQSGALELVPLPITALAAGTAGAAHALVACPLDNCLHNLYITAAVRKVEKEGPKSSGWLLSTERMRALVAAARWQAQVALATRAADRNLPAAERASGPPGVGKYKHLLHGWKGAVSRDVIGYGAFFLGFEWARKAMMDKACGGSAWADWLIDGPTLAPILSSSEGPLRQERSEGEGTAGEHSGNVSASPALTMLGTVIAGAIGGMAFRSISFPIDWAVDFAHAREGVVLRYKGRQQWLRLAGAMFGKSSGFWWTYSKSVVTSLPGAILTFMVYEHARRHMDEGMS